MISYGTNVLRGPASAILAILFGLLAISPPAAAPKINRGSITIPQQKPVNPSPAKILSNNKVNNVDTQELPPCLTLANSSVGVVALRRRVGALRLSVPLVVGETLDEAKLAAGDKFILQLVPSNPGPQWVVSEQSPVSGIDVPICIVLVLHFVAPPIKPPAQQMIRMPNILQWPEASIKSRLGEIHLNYLGVTQEKSDRAAPGTVFDQFPEPNEMVSWGTPVHRVIAVSLPPPKNLSVSLSSSAQSVFPRETVTFTARMVPDQKGAEYQFDFGDQTQNIVTNQPQVRHAYQTDGNYTARVTVLVNDRAFEGKSPSIVVHDAVYSVKLIPTPQDAQLGQPVHFHAEVWSSDSSVPNPSFTFEFGDNSDPVQTTSPDATHTYAAAEIFEARVSLVVEHQHKVQSKSTEVGIFAPPPPPPPPPEPSPWPYIAIGAGLAAILGTGGYFWIRKYFTRRVGVLPNSGTGLVHLREDSTAANEAVLGFRPVHPSAISNAIFPQRVILKIERIV